MTYAVRVSNSILINQNGDVELHSIDEIIKALRETLGADDGKGTLLFGEFEPVFVPEADDPCRFNTINRVNASHRIVGFHVTKESNLLYAHIEFLPSSFGEIAKKWYHRDPNHLILVPRAILDPGNQIKILITLDLKVNRG